MIDDQVTNHMQELGMTGGRFEVRVDSLPDDKLGASGSDRIEFTVAINPGQAAGPLAKIASGGELSRISLALQVVAMQQTAVPTLIFDEVDSGVGGGVAEIVGTRLRELAGSRQVLCVTHLPQVASQAGNHLRVAKITDGQSTRTTVKSLTPNERIEEIARMLGGVKITDRTRAHAEEMLG
jgi:DNA repair protein RecN (Recombination protein N)